MSIHVPEQIRQKIWRNEFINLALLLKGSVELSDLCAGSGMLRIGTSGFIESAPKTSNDKLY